MLWGSPEEGGGLASQAASPMPALLPPLLCTAVRPRPLSQDVVRVLVQGQSEPRGQAEREQLPLPSLWGALPVLRPAGSFLDPFGEKDGRVPIVWPPLLPGSAAGAASVQL